MMGEGERALFRATSARADSPARTRFARVRRATIAELVTARGGELRQSARPSSYLLRPCFPLSPLLLSLLLVFPFSVPFLPIAVLAGDRDHQPSPLAGATRGTPGSRCALGGPRGPILRGTRQTILERSSPLPAPATQLSIPSSPSRKSRASSPPLFPAQP
ncbi:hypothetical protein BKA93DRAFT_12043 [Sparassis latifolia]